MNSIKGKFLQLKNSQKKKFVVCFEGYYLTDIVENYVENLNKFVTLLAF